VIGIAPDSAESTASRDSAPSHPRVIVAQLGARRHYLVPATFHVRGMLVRFYTDFYLTGVLGSLVARAAHMLPVAPLRRLAGRRDADLPDTLVTSFPAFARWSRVTSRSSKRRSEQTRAWISSGERFGELVAARGFDSADAVYAYSSAALEIFEAAKKQGKFCILDHATAPKRFEDALTMRQAERYPGWSAAPPQEDRWVDEYADRQNRETELADLIICGSTFVRDAVQTESGQGHKCEIVPLGLRHLPEDPVPKNQERRGLLRILFVGDEAIRKGIGDLFEAVRRFGVDRCEARVAGNIDLSEHGRKQVEGTLTLLGSVPRDQMAGQYRWADVCVLPSVSDTFGLVILEALSYGVPVITTSNTGGADVIEEAVNGYVVPICDPTAIADRLREIAADRSLLASLSLAAIEKSREFGIDTYADRLTEVVMDRFRKFTAASKGPPVPTVPAP
jgi:glycosyltransferase involved in cell wall biosynthesis